MARLDQLLTTKVIRHDKAERALRAQVDAVAHAAAEREEAARRLDACKRDAMQKEDQAFRELCSRPVLLRDIEDTQLHVAALRAGVASADDADAKAHCVLRDHEAALVTRRDEYHDARRVREKFAELTKREACAERAMAEAAEDRDIEEVAQRSASGQSAGVGA